MSNLESCNLQNLKKLVVYKQNTNCYENTYLPKVQNAKKYTYAHFSILFHYKEERK